MGMQYLGSGLRIRGTKFDNANDRLAELEGSRHPAQRSRSLVSPTPPVSWAGSASTECADAARLDECEQYEELARLLQMREAQDGQPLPERDTKRAVAWQHLKNMAELSKSTLPPSDFR